MGAGIAAAVLAASGLALVLAPPSAATLGPSPSQFESGDGNMILNTDGNTDWNCFNSSAVLSTTTGLSCNSAVTGVTFGPPTGSSPAVNFPAPNAYTGNDPSWVPGQKMDQGTCIPGTDSKSPAKDTFTDVASYNETAVSGGALGDTYLYGATERVAANGSASENIELSKTAGQNAPSGACTNSPVIYRTAGDKLIALNYISGGSTLAPPQILTWVTSSSGLTDSTGTYAGSCVVSSDQVPCWSSTVETMPAGTFEGRTNPAPIPAGQNGIGGDALAIAQFAEFGINLSTVGVIPTGSCSAFAQETWEARSSGSSFTSNPSDIEVETHQVSNCGNVTVIKHTDPRTSSQQFSYTSSGLLDNSKAGGTCSGIAS
ncbi:MAG TPA: hypothetical protein VFH70_02875, partial [Acidimicrobiales bacterium]|nr:hypothetical protein [Acidimicrobiales bacterium]